VEKIETFKILAGKERVDCSRFLALVDVTSGFRGYSLKLFKQRCGTTIRQNFFSLRVVSEWDKLPKEVVDLCRHRLPPHSRTDRRNTGTI